MKKIFKFAGMRPLVATALVLASVGFAKGEDNPRAAILCVWSQQSFLLFVGENCKPDDNEMLDTLKKNVSNMESVILSNQYAAQAQLDATRNQLKLDLERAPGGMCRSGGALDLYMLFKQSGPAKLAALADVVLDVERKPATNPCQ